MYNMYMLMLHVCTHVSWHGPDRSSSREGCALWPGCAVVDGMARSRRRLPPCTYQRCDCQRERFCVECCVAFGIRKKALHGGRVENSRPPAEFRTRIRPNSRIRRIRSISAEFGVTFRYITSFVARSRLLPSRRVPPPALPRAQTAPAAPAPTLPCPDPPVTPALRRLGCGVVFT